MEYDNDSVFAHVSALSVAFFGKAPAPLSDQVELSVMMPFPLSHSLQGWTCDIADHREWAGSELMRLLTFFKHGHWGIERLGL